MEATFLELVAGMAYAVPVIFGLVEFLKAALSLDGKAVTLTSFLVGVAIAGSVFAAFQLPDIAIYVAGAHFILASGLVASGYYKFANARWPKAE